MQTAQGAIGVVLKDPSGKIVLASKSMRVGEVRDPHEAEYKALIAGLQLALACYTASAGTAEDRHVFLEDILEARLVINR